MWTRSLSPLWEELNRRKTVVFIHPTVPYNYHPIAAQAYIPPPVLDFPHETTRTVGSSCLDRNLEARRLTRRENRYLT